ncbi:MAG: chemotaxis protein CheA [Proteobacteria bacterium]|nr:chemotaxis protein CheA [Pseudomonadota bacterium]
MIDAEFLAMFLDEATELLEQWESSCLKLEQNPKPEIINELFRAAHNLKGSARSVGLDTFGAFVHKIEDFISLMKNNEIIVDSDSVALTLESQKHLLDWINELKSNSDAVKDLPDFLGQLDHCAKKNSLKREKIESINSASESKDILEKAKFTDTPSSQPKDLGTILVESGDVKPEDLERALKLQNRKLGEVMVAEGIATPDTVKKALEQQRQTGHKPDETLRVSLRKLDAVIRLIGELSIQISIVNSAKDQGNFEAQTTSEAISLTHKIVQDLQSESMTLRMQPLDALFQRMERVARDVARQQGKKISVILKGTDVELDKTVVEAMKDPLVHILRNAVDHGIENEETRVKLGKPPIATVTIEGIQTASNVTIRISDDGQGLNEERILKKARDRNLVSKDIDPPPHEIHKFIFMPGFSTAEVVTDVSGRGVGMDVVKRSVDDLGGDIDIQSQRNKGTEFNITLPSTLSILDAIVIGLNGTQFAIPIQDVIEVIDMKSTIVETSTKKGRLINLRGKVLPLESLDQYLPVGKPTLKTQKPIALIARHQSTTVAFEVDQIEGQQSIVVRQLEGNLSKVAGFAGGTILATGEPSMIIHLPQVLKSYISTVK